jgi:hypothetical protein
MKRKIIEIDEKNATVAEVQKHLLAKLWLAPERYLKSSLTLYQ